MAVLVPSFLILLFGAASAMFSAAETALFSLRNLQIERLNVRYPRGASVLEALRVEPGRLLSTILLADTLANVPLCLLCLYVLRDLPRTGWMEAPFWLAALGLFILVVVVCDLLPKLLARQNPEGVAGPALTILCVVRPALAPVSDWLGRLGGFLSDRLTPRALRSPLQLTEGEFESIVHLGTEAGALQASESEMIQEIIKLGDKTAKDVMTPRVDAFAVPDDLTNAEAVERLRATRHRRVPIYGDTPDDILGVLNTRRFLESIHAAGGDPAAVAPYHEALDPPSYVSETMGALNLLRSFLAHSQGLAIVVDEYGGAEGVVTISDIIEEIIGDALPRGSGDEALYLEELEPGRQLLAGGHARLEDIAEHAGFESLPAVAGVEGVDTIGGLLFNRLGYLPRAGSDVPLPGGLHATVRQATRRRIEEVLLEVRGAESGVRNAASEANAG